MTLAPWSQPQALGHGLEIIPRTDLSNIHAGDLVEVDVLFNGKPLGGEMAAITAYSNNFGHPEALRCPAHSRKAKGSFRVQSAGQWVILTKHTDKVTKDGPFKDLYGIANMVARSASFDVHSEIDLKKRIGWHSNTTPGGLDEKLPRCKAQACKIGGHKIGDRPRFLLNLYLPFFAQLRQINRGLSPICL